MPIATANNNLGVLCAESICMSFRIWSLLRVGSPLSRKRTRITSHNVIAKRATNSIRGPTLWPVFLLPLPRDAASDEAPKLHTGSEQQVESLESRLLESEKLCKRIGVNPNQQTSRRRLVIILGAPCASQAWRCCLTEGTNTVKLKSW